MCVCFSHNTKCVDFQMISFVNSKDIYVTFSDKFHLGLRKFFSEFTLKSLIHISLINIWCTVLLHVFMQAKTDNIDSLSLYRGKSQPTFLFYAVSICTVSIFLGFNIILYRRNQYCQSGNKIWNFYPKIIQTFFCLYTNILKRFFYTKLLEWNSGACHSWLQLPCYNKDNKQPVRKRA